MAGRNSDDEIVRYEAGSAKISELGAALTAGWQDVLSDTELRDKASKLLGVSSADLSKFAAPPVSLEADRAGMTGGDIIIEIAVWFGSEVMLGTIADLAKEEAKSRLKQLWSSVLEPALRKRLSDRRHGLGKRKDSKKKDSKK